MALTPEMRSGIDRIRDYLYGGGYPDPLSNAEQLAFLFFFYLIEGIDADNAMQAKGMRRDYASIFAGDWQLRNPLNAPAKGVRQSRRRGCAGRCGRVAWAARRWCAGRATRCSRSSPPWPTASAPTS
jgi:hypothetical protein